MGHRQILVFSAGSFPMYSLSPLKCILSLLVDVNLEIEFLKVEPA
jgi:hypothetical protein